MLKSPFGRFALVLLIAYDLIRITYELHQASYAYTKVPWSINWWIDCFFCFVMSVAVNVVAIGATAGFVMVVRWIIVGNSKKVW